MRFALKRDIWAIVTLPVIVVGGAIAVLAWGDAPTWWVLGAAIAYVAFEVATSEWWFPRLNYVDVGQHEIEVSQWMWGFGPTYLAFWFRNLDRILVRRVISARLMTRGVVELEYWKADSGSHVRESKLRFAPRHPQELIALLDRLGDPVPPDRAE